MTAHRDLKNIIRDRQMKTGESYTAARVHVMRERAMLLGMPTGQVPTSAPEQRVEAIVLKVNARSARVRILGEEGQVTLRSGDVWKIVPGHHVSLAIKRRWTWQGDAYASGKIENPRIDEARGLLMEVLGTDLRCIDAHAQLGSMVFDRWPEQALIHYELGMRIGELSLPAGFDGLLIWGHIYNRPFLRCLKGYGLCLWRLGKLPEARSVFARILSLNPNDNQGVRFCWEDVRKGLTWEQVHEREEAALAERRAGLH